MEPVQSLNTTHVKLEKNSILQTVRCLLVLVPDDLCSSKHKPHSKFSCAVLGCIKCFGLGNGKRAMLLLTSATYLSSQQV